MVIVKDRNGGGDSYIHKLYLGKVETPVTRLRLRTVKTDLHVCPVGLQGGQLSIYLFT